MLSKRINLCKYYECDGVEGLDKGITTGKRSQKIGIGGITTLEADILDIVWLNKKTTVRKVHETMLKDGYIPYTTVMAAMTNMAHKGILRQNKAGKTYGYTAVTNREAAAAALVDTVVEKASVAMRPLSCCICWG